MEVKILETDELKNEMECQINSVLPDLSLNNSNFAHRFSLCTLKIQYWQLFSYLNSYAMLLEAVSSVKQVPCS